ncbi:MAG: 16S rRNA (uracil(1498)-N(3))-methyltransferase [Gammaproteobacteria bacterium]|nr:16S rRNA (uracil(1498)-N(3))-methyltransferase [Gammaproteobacteria bacterium]
MRTVRIYQDIDLQTDSLVELGKEATHHLKNVLRLKHEDQINLFNGRGGEYSARLKYSGKKILAHIGDFHNINTESDLHITLLQGVSRGERMDISIQKAVELGAQKILPVVCQRTVVNLKGERQGKKMRHWQGIIINACEQSGRNIVPELLPSIKLSELNQLNLDGLKLTLDPEGQTNIHSLKPESQSVNLLIGPEGGLSDDEINYARATGFKGIRLGPRILRTETAAIAGITVIQTIWGDFKP